MPFALSVSLVLWVVLVLFALFVLALIEALDDHEVVEVPEHDHRQRHLGLNVRQLRVGQPAWISMHIIINHWLMRASGAGDQAIFDYLNAAPRRWSIQALGTFACLVDDVACDLSPLHRALLVCLLDAGSKGRAVEQLWEDVWGDCDLSMPALHQALYRLDHAARREGSARGARVRGRGAAQRPGRVPLPDDRPLAGGVEVVVDFGFGDVPVVGDAGPEQPALWILVIPTTRALRSRAMAAERGLSQIRLR